MFTQTSYTQSVNHKHRLKKLNANATGGKAKTDLLVKVMSSVLQSFNLHNSHPTVFCFDKILEKIHFVYFPQYK